MTTWKRMMAAMKRLARGRRRRPAGAVLVEEVGPRPGTSRREQYERPDNPLQGIWGPDPDAWLDELRSAERERS